MPDATGLVSRVLRRQERHFHELRADQASSTPGSAAFPVLSGPYQQADLTSTHRRTINRMGCPALSASPLQCRSTLGQPVFAHSFSVRPPFRPPKQGEWLAETIRSASPSQFMPPKRSENMNPVRTQMRLNQHWKLSGHGARTRRHEKSLYSLSKNGSDGFSGTICHSWIITF